MAASPAARTPASPLGVGMLLVLGTALVAPIFGGATLWLRDLLLYTYPLKSYAIARLRAGELPLWSESWGTGRPFFAMIQPGVLDPLNALLLLPGTLGLDVYNLVHLAIAAAGARAWLRQGGVDDDDACAGGALLGLSGYLVSMVATNGTYAWGVAFVPWTLAAMVASAQASGRPAFARHAAAVAATLTLALLAGDPMAVLFAALAGAAQGLGAPSTHARARALATLACGALVAALVCAVQLVPALEMARTYRGGGVSLRDAANFSLHPVRWLELLTPTPFGEPYTPGWRTPRLYALASGQPQYPFAIGLHQGVALLPLAVAALGRRERLDRALWALAASAALLAAGRHAPVWPWVFEHVPGVRYFRYPEKYWLLATLALAALAARGLGVARLHARTSARLALGIALALAAGAALCRGSPIASHLPALAPSLLRSAVFAVAYAAAYAAAGEPRVSPRVARAAPSLLLGLELLLASLPIMSWMDPAPAREPPPFVAAIARDRGATARGARVFRDLTLALPLRAASGRDTIESLGPNVGLVEGVGHLDSYEAVVATRVRRLRGEVRRTPGPLLRWWGVDYAVTTSGGAGDPAFRPVATDARLDLHLLRVEGTAPRVYLAEDTVTVHGPGEALRVARSAGFVPGSSATVEGPRRTSRGGCAVREARPERRLIRCDASAPAWVIVGESYDPSWSATVNGAHATIVRGNELFMAVPVPAGRSEMRMEMRAAGFREGAAISALGLCLALGLCVYGRASGRVRSLTPRS